MAERHDTPGSDGTPAGFTPGSDAPSRLSPAAAGGPGVGDVPGSREGSQPQEGLAGNRDAGRPAGGFPGMPWVVAILVVIVVAVILLTVP